MPAAPWPRRSDRRVEHGRRSTISASMRLTMPASTLPGPHSTDVRQAARAHRLHHLDPAHRRRRPGGTAHRGCASGRSRTATSTLLTTADRAASRTARRPAARAARSAAGFIRLRMERRRHRQRAARAWRPGLEHLAGLSTPALLPAITVCFGIVEVGGLDDLAAGRGHLRRSRRAPPAASSPRMAAIAPAPTGTASCIACARKRTSGSASAKRQRAGGHQRACTRPASGRPPPPAPAPPSARQAR